MKTHKTYKITLALLAALLAVIGTTGTVVQADGPGGDDGSGGGSTQVPGGLTPEQALQGEEMNMWNSLDPSTQTLVRDEVIPTISHRAGSRQSQERELRSVVRALHRIEQKKAEAVNADSEEDICYFAVDASRNGASAFMNCAPYEMNAISVHVELQEFTGSEIGHHDNRCANSTWCYAYVDATPSTPCYRWVARGSGVPTRDSPPYPAGNYWDEDDFCKNGIPV